MLLKRMLTKFLVIVSLIPGAVFAQASMSGDLTVSSSPAGAQVTLSGGAIVSGVTPARFRHLLIGNYKLTLKRHGYETYKTKILLDPSKQMEMNIKLSPKTRFKAAARSIFIPGWGQVYADQKLKGYAFTLLTASAVTAYFIADNDFNDKRDYFNEIKSRYDSLNTHGNIEQLRSLYPLLVKAQDDAYDAENVRRITIGTVIGAWGLNVLDALFFFPEEKSTFSVKGLTVTPSADLTNVGLKVSLKM